MYVIGMDLSTFGEELASQQKNWFEGRIHIPSKTDVCKIYGKYLPKFGGRCW